MDSCANPVGSPFLRFFTSFQESWQVATSPCCQRHLPDSISANLSPDAWSPTPTVPSSARTCFFPDVSGLPQDTMGRLPVFIRECDFPAVLVFEVADISLCSSLRVCSSPRSLLPLRVFPQGSRDLLRPGISCFVTSARSGYAIRPIQAIDGKRTFTFQDLQPCRLLQCLTNRTVSPFPAPATSHPASGFPALGAPVCFLSRVMRPSE